MRQDFFTTYHTWLQSSVSWENVSLLCPSYLILQSPSHFFSSGEAFVSYFEKDQASFPTTNEKKIEIDHRQPAVSLSATWSYRYVFRIVCWL